MKILQIQKQNLNSISKLSISSTLKRTNFDRFMFKNISEQLLQSIFIKLGIQLMQEFNLKAVTIYHCHGNIRTKRKKNEILNASFTQFELILDKIEETVLENEETVLENNFWQIKKCYNLCGIIWLLSFTPKMIFF